MKKRKKKKKIISKLNTSFKWPFWLSPSNVVIRSFPMARGLVCSSMVAPSWSQLAADRRSLASESEFKIELITWIHILDGAKLAALESLSLLGHPAGQPTTTTTTLLVYRSRAASSRCLLLIKSIKANHCDHSSVGQHHRATRNYLSCVSLECQPVSCVSHLAWLVRRVCHRALDGRPMLM